MRVHCVAFIACSLAEIADGSAFRRAAKFCSCEATIVIRCEDTGQDLQVHCPESIHGYDPMHFDLAWRAKHRGV